jgi:hypothetical protein
MDDFLHVNLGNILTIFAFLVGGVSFAYTIKSDLATQNIRMEMLHEQNTQRLIHLETEIKILREVVIDQARQRMELQALNDKLSLFERRFDRVLEYLYDGHKEEN